MKLFQKLIAAPAIISLASGFAVNASEINTSDLGKFSNSINLVSSDDYRKSINITISEFSRSGKSRELGILWNKLIN